MKTDILEDLLKAKQIPSPLILEGESHADWLKRIVSYALCQTQSACGSCAGCKKTRQGFHPDWIELKGSLKIDELRQQLIKLRQRPYEANVRVLTISDFQEASDFIQNALLKTLEEPEAHWLIVLGLTSRQTMLSTLRSRCLFYPLKDAAHVELSDEEEDLYRLMKRADDFTLYQKMENLLKDRHKTKAAFVHLMRKASSEFYPEHWQNLAPHLEQALTELDRNLNQRLVWERAWAQSFADFN